MLKTVVNKSKSCVSFKFYFHCSTQEQLLQLYKYSLGSYHKVQHTHSISITTLTASQEAHTLLNMKGAASSSSNNNSFNNKIKYKAGNYLVHV